MNYLYLHTITITVTKNMHIDTEACTKLDKDHYIAECSRWEKQEMQKVHSLFLSAVENVLIVGHRCHNDLISQLWLAHLNEKNSCLCVSKMFSLLHFEAWISAPYDVFQIHLPLKIYMQNWQVFALYVCNYLNLSNHACL